MSSAPRGKKWRIQLTSRSPPHSFNSCPGSTSLSLVNSPISTDPNLTFFFVFGSTNGHMRLMNVLIIQ